MASQQSSKLWEWLGLAGLWRLAGASRYANVFPKEVCKTVVLLENYDSSNKYPLTHDMIMCYAEV